MADIYFSKENATKTLIEYFLCSHISESFIKAVVEQIPSSDVVEVVRCKDCKHRPVVDEGGTPHAPVIDGAYRDETCPGLCLDSYYNWMPKDDWFCALGEKKDD